MWRDTLNQTAFWWPKATSINGIHASSWSTDLMAVSRRQEGALSFPSIFLVGNSWGTTYYAGNTNVDSVARCDVSWHNCFRYFCLFFQRVTVWRLQLFLACWCKWFCTKNIRRHGWREGSGTSITTLFIYNAIVYYSTPSSALETLNLEDSTEAQPDTGILLLEDSSLRAGLSVSSTRCFFSAGG